ncbi:unnamed protein product [Paramecium sonneborni]|uniref:Uncharacterized protein n=1 Tax=Paramecium sonneborni TaxID=65129 RepID=A0A8S1RNL0_9CILI|nr:unnamed protein product [Paramecium sonneborni]
MNKLEVMYMYMSMRMIQKQRLHLKLTMYLENINPLIQNNHSSKNRRKDFIVMQLFGGVVQVIKQAAAPDVDQKYPVFVYEDSVNIQLLPKSPYYSCHYAQVVEIKQIGTQYQN